MPRTWPGVGVGDPLQGSHATRVSSTQTDAFVHELQRIRESERLQSMPEVIHSTASHIIPAEELFCNVSSPL